MPTAPTLVWFRQDLRLHDNPALLAAIKRGAPVIPVYIFDEVGEGTWPLGGASRWWLHHSLAALSASLQKIGSQLVIKSGPSGCVLDELLNQTGATAVYWNRRYEPAVILRDKTLKTAITAEGIEAKSFNAALLFEPHTIENKQGKPFQVFTPYWRHCLNLDIPAPDCTKITTLLAPVSFPKSATLESLSLLPAIDWDKEFYAHWTPGEAGAEKRLHQFTAKAINLYSDKRDLPAATGTSGLSPHLHFGEISPRQIWHAVKEMTRDTGLFPPGKGAQIFLNEIGWREFAHHQIFHFPTTPEKPLREDFERFPWAQDPKGVLLKSWQRGMTGYPIVDAGMRELWHTGWMHNRVRMVVASFLVKHLRLPWQRGAEWFWDTLVDADLAQNTMGWQWSAGCGADAAPYFRIFAPVTQGEKFDGAGVYVRRWVPELAKLPDKYLHSPWTAPREIRAYAKIEGNYPDPIVDHASARAEALAAFQSLKKS